MNGRYRLIGQTPVPVEDTLEWDEAFETEDRQVALTHVSETCDISTMFLGLDHQFGDGPPLLFETMAFIGGESEDCTRASTWLEAEAQHAAMVREVTEKLKAPKMTYTQTGDKITLEMSQEDYENLLVSLGLTAGWYQQLASQEDFYRWIDFVNRLNATNPKYIPYKIPAEFQRKEPV